MVSVEFDADKMAAEVIDRLMEALPIWMAAQMKDGDWKHDPWGEMMGWWFALNDVCYTLNLPCQDSYTPGALGMKGIDVEDYRYGVLLDGLIFRVLDQEEVAGWHKLFDTAYHALKLLGKDY